MQLILVFLASSLQGPSLDPTPSILYCRDSSFFEPNQFGEREHIHCWLCPFCAPRQSQIPHLPQFWRVNKQTKGTPLQKQSERGLLGRPKRSAELALQVSWEPNFWADTESFQKDSPWAAAGLYIFSHSERKLVSTRINGLRRHNELLAAGVDDILFEHEWDLAASARVSEISIFEPKGMKMEADKHCDRWESTIFNMKQIFPSLRHVRSILSPLVPVVYIKPRPWRGPSTCPERCGRCECLRMQGLLEAWRCWSAFF